jgi:hypothetical protein
MKQLQNNHKLLPTWDILRAISSCSFKQFISDLENSGFVLSSTRQHGISLICCLLKSQQTSAIHHHLVYISGWTDGRRHLLVITLHVVDTSHFRTLQGWTHPSLAEPKHICKEYSNTGFHCESTCKGRDEWERKWGLELRKVLFAVSLLMFV